MNGRQWGDVKVITTGVNRRTGSKGLTCAQRDGFSDTSGLSRLSMRNERQDILTDAICGLASNIMLGPRGCTCGLLSEAGPLTGSGEGNNQNRADRLECT